MSAPEPFGTKAKALAARRDPPITDAELVLEAHYRRREPGTKPETIRKAMAGTRRATNALVEAVADVLDVDPAEFVEYRLSHLRRQLDESDTTGVGFQQAASLLEAIEEGLRVPDAHEFARVIAEALERSGSPSTNIGARGDSPRRPARGS